MTKKHFIAFADFLKTSTVKFNAKQLEELAVFCRTQNNQFKTDRWLDYIAGKCGPNGGKVKS
ncbi:MAG: hypothetical protein KGL39_34280 [Patescibacteria group bacterium]|nr:hypothetical protein [Patescibacteria group bacterium]